MLQAANAAFLYEDVDKTTRNDVFVGVTDGQLAVVRFGVFVQNNGFVSAAWNFSPGKNWTC